jgi:hypothetical protein
MLSRDEKKQEDMRLDFADSRMKFYIGDVRQYDSVFGAMRGVDFVFQPRLASRCRPASSILWRRCGRMCWAPRMS